MKDITFVFGKNSDGNFDKYSLGNVMLVGSTGSGKGVLLRNIIDSMLLRYEHAEVGLMVFDEKSIEFVTPNMCKGIKYTHLCQWASCGVETTYVAVLRKLVHILDERKYFDIWVRTPIIIILDGFDISETKTSGIYAECLKYLLSEGPKFGMYFLICMQPVLTHIQKYVEYMQYKLCLKIGNKTVSNILVGTDSATEIERNCHVYLSCGDDKGFRLTVPYYNREAKRDICNGVILPNGAKFSESHIRSYAISNGLLEVD